MIWFAACSDGDDNAGAAGTASGTGGGSGDAGELDCDPRPGSDAGKSDAVSSSGGTVGGGLIDVNLNPEGGTTFPDARWKCYDADSGAGFMCENFGQQCCVKKDVCYDPATEPSFCDRPYCE